MGPLENIDTISFRWHAYSCVIAVNHFLNGPHVDVYGSISKCLVYLNTSAHRIYVV